MGVSAIVEYLGQAALYNYRSMFRDDVLRRSREVFDRGDRARDGLATLADMERRRDTLRRRFIEALGGLPPMDTPLNAVTTGIVQGPGFHVENVIFEPRPGTHVTANLYVPEDISGRTGAVLFLCGHWEQGKQAEEYQAVCQTLVRAGLVVLAQDPIGQGERLSYYDSALGQTTVPWGVDEHTYAGHQCLMAGDSIARYFVHDAMRSIDYLCTRPEVDPAKIGVTGNSGGGTQTSLVMICDERIAAAAPATFLMSRRAYQATDGAQDLEQIWPGMTALGFDHEDILLALAPKPVLVSAVTGDFFPIEGTRATVGRARRFWEMAGRGGDLELTEDDSDHHYTPALACASARFFAQHLLCRDVSPDFAPVPLPAGQLQCTRTGQVRGDYPDERAVYEETAGRLAAIMGRRQALPDAEAQAQALSWLRARVEEGREPCPLNPRFVAATVINGLRIQSAAWWVRPGQLGHGLLIRSAGLADRELPLTVALWEGGTSAFAGRMEWVYDQCSAGRAVLVLDVTADGVFTPQDNGGLRAADPFGPLYKFGCDLMWLGDSIAALRIHDVLRALELAGQLPGIRRNGLALNCAGNGRLYARCAALLYDGTLALEAEPGGSVAAKAAARHYDDDNAICGYIPGMLGYFDLPDLDRWRNEGRA